MRNYRETEIQMALCKYCRLKYPKALFNVDLSGMNLSKTQSGQAKVMRSGKGFPDFMLYEPKGQYHGLFIELKAEGIKLYKESREPTTDHVIEQLAMIDELKKRGYQAMICIGLDHAMIALDTYMKL